ncbi:MAG: MetQ/NlpA family ABC transporter substrate-binding protein [Succinivibrio sp.]
MKFKILSALAIAGILSINSASAFDKDHPVLKFSKSQGPYSELFISGVQPILEKEGYKIEAVDMSDLLQADLALNEGEVDFNVEQHTAYANNFNATQDGHLVTLTPIPTVPAGIYPGAKSNLAEVSDGDVIAVPNDASNTARAYNILAKLGWIELDKNVDPSKVTKENIVKNPRNLEFVEMKSLNIPAVASDFAFVVITGSIVYNAKIDPSTVLAQEDVAEHLLLQLVVHEKNKDSIWAQDIKNAYQSAEFKSYLDKNNNGLWFVPKY